MKKIILVGAILAIGIFTFTSFKASQTPGQYDQFAQCLNEKGVKMYGAFWCPHCKEQKKEFGKSWKFVNYTECSTADGNGQLKICADANITGYPTWEFVDGERIEGKVSFEKLSEKAGCSI